MGLFDKLIFSQTIPLELGWSEGQLDPVVEVLAPNLPGLRRKALWAAASISRSLVVAQDLFGKGVHYSRSANDYSIPERYRFQGPYWSYRPVVNGMYALHGAGLVRHDTGICGGSIHGGGRQSAAASTKQLQDLVGAVIDTNEPRLDLRPTEAIVLRGRDGKLVDYEDTADAVRLRGEVHRINEALARQSLRLDRMVLPPPAGRRIFNESFDRGGRFYFLGTSVQNLRSRDRVQLLWGQDAHATPVVEYDYSGLHIAIAYSETGEEPPDGDHYTIPGYDRDHVKLAVNTMFNAKTRAKAIASLSKELQLDPQSYGARALVEAVELAHPKLSHVFATDRGARFQRIDSDIAMAVMLEMLSLTGRCPFPIHDSFIVPEQDAQQLKRVMETQASFRGIETLVK